MHSDTQSGDDFARKYLRASAEAKQKAAESCVPSIVSASLLIAEAFRANRKLLLCGNGGSAADCQHMAAEMVGIFDRRITRRALPAIALTTDTSFLTAYTNDFGYDGVFERQLEALGVPGDVLLAISTSGNSSNVLRAAEAAKARGLHTIGLTGNSGRLAATAELAIAVPADDTQHIQEAHLAIEHLICALVERELFRKEN